MDSDWLGWFASHCTDFVARAVMIDIDWIIYAFPCHETIELLEEHILGNSDLKVYSVVNGA